MVQLRFADLELFRGTKNILHIYLMQAFGRNQITFNIFWELAKGEHTNPLPKNWAFFESHESQPVSIAGGTLRFVVLNKYGHLSKMDPNHRYVAVLRFLRRSPFVSSPAVFLSLLITAIIV